MIRRAVAALLLLVATAAGAATTDQRSPFAQGHWWDPNRSGSGFDIFNAGDEVMVIWYTYDAQRKPTWFTAQGKLGELGQKDWPLLKHRWSGGRRAEPARAGTLKVTRRHPESLDVTWTLTGGAAGTSSLVPFRPSGAIPEVDRSGSWFDPANSGWGLTITEQGEVLGAVLFTYDASGAPTWAAGFGRERDAIELHGFTGPCAWCAYTAPAPRSLGRVLIDTTGDGHLTLRTDALAMEMAAGVNAHGARMVQLSRAASTRPADRGLASFPTRDSLKAYLDAGMMNLKPSGLGPAGVDFSPSPGSGLATFSPTNLIRGDVDEASLVKTDGRFIYTYAYNYLGRQPSIRIAEVGEDGTGLAVRGSVALASGASTPMAFAGLFLHDAQLVSVTGTQPATYTFEAGRSWTQGTTQVEILSLATPASPAPRWRAEIDGHMVSSRRIGDRLYLVTRFVPFLEGFIYGPTSASNAAANETQLRSTALSMLLPKIRVGETALEAVEPGAVHAPPLGSMPPVAQLTLVTAIDLKRARVEQTLAIVGGVETIYASPQNIFVASLRHSLARSTRSPLPVPGEPPGLLTDIHQIGIGAETLSVVGSGSVEGYLGSDLDLLPFRLSEHAGRLYVVTGSNLWWGSNKNRLTVLEPSRIAAGLLRTAAYLPNARRPEPLGKPNELLYATRFVGDRLYAVTFRMVDPLYVIDLANPADPRIAGELVVPGFSEYLHPMPGGLLLGFGKDATSDGLFLGLQLSLYDVSDAGRPRELQKLFYGRRGSESALLKHHHAFSAIAQADGSTLFAIPARIHDGSPSGGGAAPNYPWRESGLLRFELRPGARIAELPPMITHHTAKPQLGWPGERDPAAGDGRSILFRDATVYIGNGQFWRQDSAGNLSGPH